MQFASVGRTPGNYRDLIRYPQGRNFRVCWQRGAGNLHAWQNRSAIIRHMNEHAQNYGVLGTVRRSRYGIAAPLVGGPHCAGVRLYGTNFFERETGYVIPRVTCPYSKCRRDAAQSPREPCDSSKARRTDIHPTSRESSTDRQERSRAGAEADSNDRSTVPVHTPSQRTYVGAICQVLDRRALGKDEIIKEVMEHHTEWFQDRPRETVKVRPV